ncbi:MAG: hypothetical protein Q7K43_00585, partial [Candidatus Woesearchaeota archaeon]|nr:hypothetical protein [Candidatus Woesearchaeota archaeon]
MIELVKVEPGPPSFRRKAIAELNYALGTIQEQTGLNAKDTEKLRANLIFTAREAKTNTQDIWNTLSNANVPANARIAFLQELMPGFTVTETTTGFEVGQNDRYDRYVQFPEWIQADSFDSQIEQQALRVKKLIQEGKFHLANYQGLTSVLQNKVDAILTPEELKFFEVENWLSKYPAMYSLSRSGTNSYGEKEKSIKIQSLEPELFRIGQEKTISVHGTGDDSGLKVLLSIILEGTIRPFRSSGQANFGGLVQGDPSYAGGQHGPYYVIVDPSNKNRDLVQNHLAYLVPDSADREVMRDVLNAAVTESYITQSAAQEAFNKIVTYDELIETQGETKKVQHTQFNQPTPASAVAPPVNTMAEFLAQEAIDTARIALASKLLINKELRNSDISKDKNADTLMKGIIKAHNYVDTAESKIPRLGEVNSDGTYKKYVSKGQEDPYRPYTAKEIAEKARILRNAGFTVAEIDLLIRHGIAGTPALSSYNLFSELREIRYRTPEEIERSWAETDVIRKQNALSVAVRDAATYFSFTADPVTSASFGLIPKEGVTDTESIIAKQLALDRFNIARERLKSAKQERTNLIVAQATRAFPTVPTIDQIAVPDAVKRIIAEQTVCAGGTCTTPTPQIVTDLPKPEFEEVIESDLAQKQGVSVEVSCTAGGCSVTYNAKKTTPTIVAGGLKEVYETEFKAWRVRESVGAIPEPFAPDIQLENMREFQIFLEALAPGYELFVAGRLNNNWVHCGAGSIFVNSLAQVLLPGAEVSTAQTEMFLVKNAEGARALTELKHLADLIPEISLVQLTNYLNLVFSGKLNKNTVEKYTSDIKTAQQITNLFKIIDEKNINIELVSSALGSAPASLELRGGHTIPIVRFQGKEYIIDFTSKQFDSKN